jgi:predicted RNA-binding Zn ribbon-like protein
METTGREAAEDSAVAGAPAFLFVGGALALDLVNTEVVVRDKRRDLLADPQDVAHWWQSARRHHPDPVEVPVAPVYDRALLDALRALRAALRGIFSAVVEATAPCAADLGLLNAILATGHHALLSAPGGTLLPAYRTDGTPEAAILLPVALSAFRLLTKGDRARLHKCGNERCILLLYDTTRSATRRWCSVGCKDRDRKMKRYQRHPAPALSGRGPLAAGHQPDPVISPTKNPTP